MQKFPRNKKYCSTEHCSTLKSTCRERISIKKLRKFLSPPLLFSPLVHRGEVGQDLLRERQVLLPAVPGVPAAHDQRAGAGGCRQVHSPHQLVHRVQSEPSIFLLFDNLSEF